MGITTPLDAVVSMPLGTKEVLPIDMAGALASIAADGMYAPALLHRPGGGSRRAGAHRARGRSAPGGVGAVGPAGLRGPREERPERHRHPGSHPRTSTPPARPAPRRTPATAGSWASRPTSPRRCGSARPPTTTPWRSSAPGITGGSYPAEIWGRYMRAWHEGLEEAECGEPRAREPQLALPLDGPATTTPAAEQPPPAVHAAAPRLHDAVHDPARARRRPPPSHRHHAPAGHDHHHRRAVAEATEATGGGRHATDPRFGGAR